METKDSKGKNKNSTSKLLKEEIELDVPVTGGSAPDHQYGQ